MISCSISYLYEKTNRVASRFIFIQRLSSLNVALQHAFTKQLFNNRLIRLIPLVLK